MMASRSKKDGAHSLLTRPVASQDTPLQPWQGLPAKSQPLKPQDLSSCQFAIPCWKYLSDVAVRGHILSAPTDTLRRGDHPPGMRYIHAQLIGGEFSGQCLISAYYVQEALRRATQVVGRHHQETSQAKQLLLLLPG